MKNKRYELTCNDEYYMVVANDLIKGKQAMTLQCAKLIRLLITQVVKEDDDFKTYSCSIKKLADFLNVSKNNLYRDIEKICENLLKGIVKIGSGDPREPWYAFHWVSSASYDKNGNITLRLSDEIKPYILELEKWFTQYQLKNILTFNSFYAIRMYELLRCEEGKTRQNKSVYGFSIEYLREFFCCEKKYKTTAEFIKYVIKIAIKEINEKSDIYIITEQIKKGRKITGINFEVMSNKAGKYLEENNKQIRGQLSFN